MKSAADRMLAKLLKEETAEASDGCLQWTNNYYCNAGVLYRKAWYSWNCAAQPDLINVAVGSC